MTDTHGSTPGNGPVPPTQGDEHAQHAAPWGSSLIISSNSSTISSLSTRSIRQEE